VRKGREGRCRRVRTMQVRRVAALKTSSETVVIVVV